MSDTILAWEAYPNFTESEFICSETGERAMQFSFIAVLQKIRQIYGRPMIISSGYRSILHSSEKDKDVAGEHSLGLAADILCNGRDALALIHIAQDIAVRRIGVNQKGDLNARFVHLGIGDRFGLFPQAIWTY